MRRPEPMSARLANRKARARSRRPEAEALEGRILLYSTVGQWTYSSRITYSFMPDGTSIAGTPSVLFQKLDAIAPIGTWTNQIEQAATPWETNAHLNLALVTDNGAPFGSAGNQQDDGGFGDIRIGAMPLPAGVLAETFLPPPSNGGTAAGDIVFNSNVAWQIGGGYDLETVALHEFGHALGLGDQSTDILGAMYYSYDGIKTSLDSDDIAGIQSLYGAPQYDAFNSNGQHNNVAFTAPTINPYLNGNNQIALSNLDITSPTQVEYFPVTAPANGTGQMAVTVQSSNLSSLAPTLAVMNSSLTILAQASGSTSYGTTLSVTIPVTAGQKYYIRVSSNGSYGRGGAYGLEVNFGSQSMPPIAPPNTVVLSQPDGGGGTINALTRPIGGVGGPSTSAMASPGLRWTTVGSDTGWVDAYLASTGAEAPGPVAGPPAAGPTTDPASGVVGAVGTVAGPSTATSPAIVAPMTPLPAPGPAAVHPHSSHKLVRHSPGAARPGGPRHRGRPQGLAKTRPGQLGTDSLL